jgi:hypothetical protein
MAVFSSSRTVVLLPRSPRHADDGRPASVLGCCGPCRPPVGGVGGQRGICWVRHRFGPARISGPESVGEVVGVPPRAEARVRPGGGVHTEGNWPPALAQGQRPTPGRRRRRGRDRGQRCARRHRLTVTHAGAACVAFMHRPSLLLVRGASRARGDPNSTRRRTLLGCIVCYVTGYARSEANGPEKRG